MRKCFLFRKGGCTMELILAILALSLLTAGGKGSKPSIPEHVHLQEKHHHLLSKLSHYELVRPYRSTPDGVFVSHDLSTAAEEERNVYDRAKRHTLENKQNDGGGRPRRSASEHWARGAHDPRDALREDRHFRVDAFGLRLRLNVTRNRFLVTPTMKVEQYNEDGTREVYRPDTLCYYIGQVNDVADSSVAISNCDGLSGFINAGTEEYIIEPLVSTVGQSNVSEGHLHVMYRTKDFQLESTRLEADSTFDLRYDTPWSISLSGGRATSDSRRGRPDSRSSRPDSRSSQPDSRREKRRAGDEDQEHWVETLLTADYSMTSFHGAKNMTKYLLTVLNIVNVAYRHDTMTAKIQFAASRIILLNEASSRNMIVDRQAPASLNNVCRWAASQTVRDDTQPNHHDLAAFITRLDFGPAGYAPVTGMCAITRSCALSRDEGLLSSFILAHEAGHVFGMEHDGMGNDCVEEQYQGSIMAGVVISTYNKFFWSECSIEELNRYLRHYSCLEDSPFDNGLEELEGYPGEWYSMNDQCKFDFGEDFEQCGSPEEVDSCFQLWCIDPWDPQYCRTRKGPALDGSYCGADKWCVQGYCVYKDMGRQNGEWGKWSRWSGCTYPCGGGVKIRDRKCDNPAPSNGGKECEGEHYEYRLCNAKPCDLYEDRRAKQCEENLASYAHGGTTHTWLPNEYRSRTEQCRLSCVSSKTGDVVLTEYNVTDGTPCSYDDHYSLCVQGQCVKIGCDYIVDSDKAEDKCGVCDGDNRRCTFVQKQFISAAKKKYQPMGLLPAGARNIDVRENTNTKSFIALRRLGEKVYILNGRGLQSGPHSFVSSGARFVYTPEAERLWSVGPLQDDIQILVFWRKISGPINITYSYYLNNQTTMSTTEPAAPRPPVTEPAIATTVPSQPNVKVTEESTTQTQESTTEATPKGYLWQDQGWTQCTKTCGGGYSFHRFQCHRTRDDVKVKKMFCGQGDYNPKTTKQLCNAQSCETQKTMKTIGTTTTAATTPATTTEHEATTSTTQPPTGTSPHAQTTTAKKQTTVRSTTAQSPPPQQTTTVTAPPPTTAPPTTAPPTTAPATTTTAPATTTTATAPATTAPATTTTAPATTAPATTTAAPTTTRATAPATTTQPPRPRTTQGKKKTFRWQTNDWQECTRSCGTEGTQTRRVRCIKKLGKKVSSTVLSKCTGPKPDNQRPCNQSPCVQVFWSTGDWSRCSVTCGDGFKHRDVMCAGSVDSSGDVQCSNPQPTDTSTCNPGDCPAPDSQECVPMKSIICDLSQYRSYCIMPNYESICCTTCGEQERLSNQKKKKKGNRRNGRGG